MFKKLEGDSCIIRDRAGVYKHVDLYEWEGRLFAKFGSGYIQLKKDGNTTKDGVWLEHVELDSELFADKFGRLAVKEKTGYTALPGNNLALPSS